MPTLTLDFTVGITTDRKQVALIDNTVYVDRSKYQDYATLYKVDYANVGISVPLVTDHSDPKLDSVWTGAYSSDGHYKWYFVAIPEWVAGAYSKYDAVFGPDGLVYRSLIDFNGNPTTDPLSWELITEPTSLALNKGTDTESLNIDSTIYNRILSSNSQAAYANLVSDQCVCTDCDEEETLKKLSDFDTLLTGMLIADNRQEVTDGEIIARRIESLYL